MLLGSAFGCAPVDRQKALEKDLAEMKLRLEQLETSTRGMGEAFTTGTEDRLAELGRLTAEARAGLNGLRVDMQSISGRLEDGLATNRQFQEDVSLMREDVGLKVTAIEDRLSILESRGMIISARPKQVPATSRATFSSSPHTGCSDNRVGWVSSITTRPRPITSARAAIGTPRCPSLGKPGTPAKRSSPASSAMPPPQRAKNS